MVKESLSACTVNEQIRQVGPNGFFRTSLHQPFQPYNKLSDHQYVFNRISLAGPNGGIITYYVDHKHCQLGNYKDWMIISQMHNKNCKARSSFFSFCAHWIPHALCCHDFIITKHQPKQSNCYTIKRQVWQEL